MNRDEVVNLLQAICVYDGRKLDALVVAAWTEAATRGRWTFPDALEAVHEHYAKSTAWLMPGHVTELIRAAKRQPAPIAELRALDAPPPASDERRAEVMELVRKLADRKSVS